MPFFISDMANNKVVKEKVIAFRVTEAQLKEIEDRFKAAPPVGIRSVGMQARKLMFDWLNQRLAYKSKKEEKQAPEMYPPMLNGNGSAAA